MPSPVRVAVLSFAHSHGELWGEAFNEDPRSELVAVWDDDAARGRAAGARLQTAFEPDLDRLLGRPDLHAVAVTAEHARHADLVLRAAARGKHILCEKPMATTLADCDRMIAAVERTGVVFMQAFQMRFDPANRYIRDLVVQGRLGRIGMVYKRHSHPFGLLGWPHGSQDWFFDPALGGGGAGMDEVIHSCDWLRWVFGEPVSVVAETTTAVTGIPVEDNLAAIVRLREGGLAVLHSSWTELAATVTTQIFGDAGSVVQMYSDLSSSRMPRPMPAPILVHRRGEAGWQQPVVAEGFPRIHHTVARAFVTCLADGTPPPVTAEDGRKAVEMVLAIYRAALERRAVEFPLDKEGRHEH
jgi:predicted dehydrogenase